VNIGDLRTFELRTRMRGPGIAVRTGPFVIRLRSDIPFLADSFRFLYADFQIPPSGEFVDFHVSLKQAGGLRRWFRRQAVFSLDGLTPLNPVPLRLAVPLLEWGLNWCVAGQANKYLIIHAAVLERSGRAVMLAAPPGAGKSTLCAALAMRGWRLLTDELALIRVSDGRIDPLPRPISLKNDSISIIRRLGAEGRIGKEWPDTAKGTVAHLRPPAESVAMAGRSAAVAWIVFPQYLTGASTTSAPLSKAHAFLRMAENAFNYSLLGVAGFRTLSQVIDSAYAFELIYSDLDEALECIGALKPAVPTAPGADR
jgi:hypothetical protein